MTAHRTIASACLVMFLISLDVTIVNVALPAIHQALTVPTVSLGWAVVGYTLPFATLMLSGGALSDRFGGALCMPSAMAVLRSSVPPRQLGRAIALWAFPVRWRSQRAIMSGALVQFLTWRSIFMINIPVVVLAVCLILPELRKSRSPVHHKTVDVLGQALYVMPPAC